MIKIHLSRKLGELRWSQAVLARVTGIRPSTINDLFHEMTDRVSLVHLDKICEACDCDLFEILEYIPNDKAQNKPPAHHAEEDDGPTDEKPQESTDTSPTPSSSDSHPGLKV